MRIRQHIPSFVDGVPPAAAEITDAVSLHRVPWIHAWSLDPGFHRFSQAPLSRAPVGETRSYTGGYLLMAEHDEGRVWWVVGYMDAKLAGLPDWVAPGRSSQS